MAALTNPMHEAFAVSYAADGVLYKAALAAGTSRQYGYTIAERPDIRARIGEIVWQRFRKENITAERVIRELARIAFANAADLFDDKGNLIPVHELPDDVAATISAIDVETSRRGRGEDKEFFTIRKVKQASKMEALTVLAKHFKVIGDVDDGVNAVVNALADRLNAARNRDNSLAEDARLTPKTALVGLGQKVTYTFDDGPSKPDDLHAPVALTPNGHPDAQESDDEERLW